MGVGENENAGCLSCPRVATVKVTSSLWASVTVPEEGSRRPLQLA